MITIIAISQTEVVKSLSVREKVLELRKHGNVPQDTLAAFIGVGIPRMVALEKGKQEYTEAHLITVKEVFKIVNLPLTERERYAFKVRMYLWRDLVRAGNMVEARARQAEIANIDKLAPCDIDLVILCKMFEAVFLIADGNYAAAEKNLNQAHDCLGEISNETLYHYYCCKGYINITQYCCDVALEWYLKAYELTRTHANLFPKVDSGLIGNIATCYTYLNFPHDAIFFLQEAKPLYTSEKMMIHNVYSNTMFAVNQIHVNRLNEAKRLLEKCSIMAESFRDNALNGRILFVYGLLNKKSGSWKVAVKYFEKAMNCLPESDVNYYPSLYHKIHTIAQTKSLANARRELDKVKIIRNAEELWTTYFIALGHFITIRGRMTLRNDESWDYIEGIAIPYFREKFDYFFALDYYQLLEENYFRSGCFKKATLMGKAIAEIHKRMLFNS